MSGRRILGLVAVVLVVAALALLPLVVSGFIVDFVLTRSLMLGLASATIVFLARYGGMVSLGQILFFAIAGFMYGNAVLESGARGLNLGWNPWLAILFALAVTTFFAWLLGAIASRSSGIYFLMLTLVYAVIGYYIFAQVITISGPSGVTSIRPPPLVDSSLRLYYTALLLSVVAYVVFKALGTTPFGMVLQGIRDDPVRVAALGVNVPVHRALAFTLAGFFAGLSGLVNVWWNGQIDPASVSIGPALSLLIIAVIGGISYFEGAWIGAFVYVAANNYLRSLPLVDQIGITADRFNTLIGVLVLLIMVLSPEGLVGIAARARRLVSGGRGTREPDLEDAASGTASKHGPVTDSKPKDDGASSTTEEKGTIS